MDIFLIGKTRFSWYYIICMDISLVYDAYLAHSFVNYQYSIISLVSSQIIGPQFES